MVMTDTIVAGAQSTFSGDKYGSERGLMYSPTVTKEGGLAW